MEHEIKIESVGHLIDNCEEPYLEQIKISFFYTKTLPHLIR